MTVSKGTVITPTKALESLCEGESYYFLRSPARSAFVYLVEFYRDEVIGAADEHRQMEPRAILHAISKKPFEDALPAGTLGCSPAPATMPPWFDGLTVSDLGEVAARQTDRLRAQENRRAAAQPGKQSKARSHSDRVDARYVHIVGAVEEFEAIMAQPDPIEALNKYARECQPPQNSARFRTWVFLYVLFGRHGLHYIVSNIGQWNRYAPKYDNARSARGHVTKDWKERILASYAAHRKSALIMPDIYVKAMRSHFGCVSFRTQTDTMRLVHPKGEKFPTENEYAYHVTLEFGRDEIKVQRIGPRMVREKKIFSEGAYTENLSNVMEVGEYDPYHCAELPKLPDGSADPGLPLIVNRIRESVSGSGVAISFEMGAESEAGLNAAKFFAYLPKVLACSLFGVGITEQEFPMMGMPLKLVMDKGPGAATMNNQPANEPPTPMPELTPTRSGQSKAIVETANPKRPHNNEGKQYVQSNLTVGALMRREIRLMIRENNTRDMSNRLADSWLKDLDVATPTAVYNEFARRGRNDAQQLPFEDAVRKLLVPVDISAYFDRIEWLGKRYRSKSLEATGFFRRIAKRQRVDLSAYHLLGCTRYLWLDYRGVIHWLELQLVVDHGTAEAHKTVDELEEAQRQRKRLKKNLTKHRQGVRAAAEEDFEAENGKAWTSGRVVKGRPRQTQQHRAAQREHQRHHRGK